MSPNTLSTNAIKELYGGSQPFMRTTTIKDQSYLCPFKHPNMLKVGDSQKMHFTESDPGPFYLNEQERKERIYDTTIGTKRRNSPKPNS